MIKRQSYPHGHLVKAISLASCLAFLLIDEANAQLSHYWSQNFNEESSLLSGAVAGGGAGNSAVYYNPATIAESQVSSLAVNASLFSFNFSRATNALGEDIKLNSTGLVIQPRFISYHMHLKKAPKLSMEFVFLNNQIYRSKYTQSANYVTDIIVSLPGDERYLASFINNNNFRDDWIGVGGSWKMSDGLYAGASLFIKIKSFSYENVTDIQAYPLQDSIMSGNSYIPFYSAGYTNYQYLRFNDYRLVGKLGIMYKLKYFSCGLSFTTPSQHVYSDGKRVYKKISQNDITDPESGDFLPNILLYDFKQKKDVDVNYKDPASIAAGAVFRTKDDRKAFYTTIEYFFPLNFYNMIDVGADPLITNEQTYEKLPSKEFLSYVTGNHWILNMAFGYRWTVRDNLRLLGGFRTDFNYQNRLDYSEYPDYNRLEMINLDLYHFTGGAVFTIKGQDILLGVQYTMGVSLNQEQIINLSDPVEYNTVERAALQGTRQNTMNVIIGELGLFFGATFNFLGNKK